MAGPTETKPGQLMIKVCFPEEIGPVKHEDLNTFLRVVQKIGLLKYVKCTLGARVFEKPAIGGSDELDNGEDSSGVTLNVLGYYCRTAAPFGLCNGKDTLKPAVIIELFFAYQIDIPDKESIVSSIKYALLDTIQCTKHKNATINIVTFLLFKD